MMIGRLPAPVWVTVARVLSAPPLTIDEELVEPVLALRATCRLLRRLLATHCRNAVNVEVNSVASARRLLAADTAGLGRTVFIDGSLSQGLVPEAEREPVAREILPALAVAVERGHMLSFFMPYEVVPADVFAKIEEMLVAAAGRDQLESCELHDLSWFDWRTEALQQLTCADVVRPTGETLEAIVRAGAMRRFSVTKIPRRFEIARLRGIQEVELQECHAIQDLAPLADVAFLYVHSCKGIEALPAMRNAWLDVFLCKNLVDVSGLAGGHVGTLRLHCLPKVEDVSAVGAMRPLPRTVSLEELNAVRDVSMLAAVDRLEVHRCCNLEKASVAAALKGKIGMLDWIEASPDDYQSSYDSDEDADSSDEEDEFEASADED